MKVVYMPQTINRLSQEQQHLISLGEVKQLGDIQYLVIDDEIFNSEEIS